MTIVMPRCVADLHTRRVVDRAGDLLAGALGSRLAEQDAR